MLRWVIAIFGLLALAGLLVLLAAPDPTHPRADRNLGANRKLAAYAEKIDAETDGASEDPDIEIQPPQVPKIDVLVVDEIGNALPGASVYDADRLLPERYRGYRGLLGDTDATGHCRFEHSANTSLRLVAIHDNCGSDAVTVQADSDHATRTATLRIRASKIMYSSVSVTVTDVHGKPIPKIKLVWREPRWIPRTTRLDRHGVATFPASPYDVEFASGGFAGPGAIRTDAKGSAVLNVAAPVGAPILVRTLMRAGSPYLSSAVPASTGDSVTLVVRKGELRTVVLRSANGENRTRDIGLRIIGPAVAWKFDGPGLRYLLDPHARYIVQSGNTSAVLDPNWVPPFNDVATEFLVGSSVASKKEPMTLRGRVIDATGAPLMGVTVDGNRRVLTRADGSFVVPMGGVDSVVGFQHARRATIYRAWKRGTSRWNKPIVLPHVGKLRIEIHAPGRWCPEDWRLACRGPKWPEPKIFTMDPISRTTFATFPRGFVVESNAVPPYAHLALHSGARGTVPGLPAGPIHLRLYTDGYEIRTRVVIGPQTQTVIFDLR